MTYSDAGETFNERRLIRHLVDMVDSDGGDR